MQDHFRAELWSSMVRSTHKQAVMSAGSCSELPADLILGTIRRFCAQQEPHSDEELAVRHRQHLAVSSRVTAILHADMLARIHPRVEDELEAAVRPLVSTDLPATEEALLAEATRQIQLFAVLSEICQHDLGQTDGQPRSCP